MTRANRTPAPFPPRPCQPRALTRSLQAGRGRAYLTYLFVFSTLFAACTIPDLRSPKSVGLSMPDHLLVRTGSRVSSVPLEDYVLAAALSEVTPLNESPATVERIYEVQAVLARTYAISHLGRHRADGFDLCDTTHCQLYEPVRTTSSRFSNAARAAVARTAGVILTYSQHPAEALFHADCGGSTTGADAVWGGAAVPYLASTSDTVPSATHRSWKISIPSGDLRAALNADARSRVGRRLDVVQIVQKDVSGRAARILLNGEEQHQIRGEELRAILDQKFGDRAIQSTRFSVTKASGSYVFQGTGLGHGVGLCQLGAAARARRGESLEHILGAYFKGARLSRLK